MAATLTNPYDTVNSFQSPQDRRRALLGLGAIAIAVAALTVVSLAFGTNKDFTGGAVAAEVSGS